MSRPTRALIDLHALQANYRRAADLASPAQAMAVVKADGYGHGLVQVAQALSHDAPMFAVACLEEALRIRQAGLAQPVVLLEGVHEPGDYLACARHHFSVVIHASHQIDWLESNAAAFSGDCWLKVNTGMNRLGFAPEAIPAQMERLGNLGIEIKGLLTHLACADEPDAEMTQAQLAIMQQFRRRFPSLAMSAANSAAHYRAGASSFDWTRPGVMLYGSAPLAGQSQSEAGLLPVMRLQSEVIAVRDLAPGDQVGYGAAWTADRAGRMAVIAIGYGDGYPRHAPSGTPVWVDGTRVPLIGRVSMDMLTVDLTQAPHIAVGAPVELWGEHVSVDEVAHLAGTISYELLTGVTARVPRHYQSGLS